MKYRRVKFEDIDLNDPLFDSLKRDYPSTEQKTGFVEWFRIKAEEGRYALVLEDNNSLGAFVSIKEENEPLELTERILPKRSRLKICTFCLAERYRGQRIGEGSMGIVLWKWQRSKLREVYVTVFPKQKLLITLPTRLGFEHVGDNSNGECVYLRSRERIDYSDPYKSFPFIRPNFSCAGYVLVEDGYHDTLFPYSELKNTRRESLLKYVSNGLTKCYVGAQWSPPPYQVGDPVLIYRKYTGTGLKRYRSCLTTYCVVTDIIWVKKNGRFYMTLDDLWSKISNKTVFDRDDIVRRYSTDNNVIVITLLYHGFFGIGNNITMDWLDKNGLWSDKSVRYPSMRKLSRDEFTRILQEGQVNVDNVIID